MKSIKVNLGERSYPIFIGPNTLQNTGTLLRKIIKGNRIGVITNSKVAKYYLPRCKTSLEKSGYDVTVIKIPDGEEYKNLGQISLIYDRLVKAKFDRGDTLLALGGGVTGDMAGFAAATYMRGIDYIQAPTTLLAQVDSSVGGKTGVDHSGGKNLIGAFHQPKAVLADTSAFGTLPDREFRCGMAEVIKYGVIRSTSLFSFLEKSASDIKNKKQMAIEKIIVESCRIKAKVVSEDERESGVRAILNMGHTFGHGIETALGFKKLKHGEAVAIGMALAARLSYRLGDCDEKTVNRIENLIKVYGLPVKTPKGITAGDVIKGMSHDKKAVGGVLRFIIPTAIGSVAIKKDISVGDIRAVING